MGNDNSSALTLSNEHDGYSEIIVSKAHEEEEENSDDQHTKVILNRKQKYTQYVQQTDVVIPWTEKTVKQIGDENVKHAANELLVYNEIVENMDGFGVFKLKTNGKHILSTLKICMSSRYLLQFTSFHDSIIEMRLRRDKNQNRYFYSMRLLYPVTRSEAVNLINYNIKRLQQTDYIRVDYTMQRIKKECFDESKFVFDNLQTLQTKLKTKWMEQESKLKHGYTYKSELMFIEEYTIRIQSMFASMAQTVLILIPIRTLNQPQISILSLNSNVHWGSVKLVQHNGMHALQWSLKFMKGNASHSLTVQLQFIANCKQSIEQAFDSKRAANLDSQTHANYAHKDYIYDNKIECKWKKPFFAVSDLRIEQYSVHDDITVTSLLRQITYKELVVNEHHDDDHKHQSQDEEQSLSLNVEEFLNNLKSMKASIIALDRRPTFCKFTSWSDIKWRTKQENTIVFVKSEIFIDVQENANGGVVRIQNTISNGNVFRLCVKMKEELLLIQHYHECIFLVEYKLKKTQINGKLQYGYVYYVYCLYPPFGENVLFEYKSKRKQQSILPNLITLKCKQIVRDDDGGDDDGKQQHTEDELEWTENYRLILSAQFPATCTADDIDLSIPVYINDIQRNNVSIERMSCSHTHASLLLPDSGGKLKYNRLEDCVSWTHLAPFKGQSEISKTCQFRLQRQSEPHVELNYAGNSKSKSNRNVLVFGECEINSIEISNYTLSGIIIGGLKCIEGERDPQADRHKYDVWIRYYTKISRAP